jgi:hypothetical protein
LFRRGELSKFKRVTRRAFTPSSPFLVSLAVLLALLHAVLALTATAEKSMTADEIAHLTAGHAYNTRTDFRLHPENGNLPQRLAALPLTLAGAPLPSTTLETWKTADIWNYGHTFFYEQGLSVGEFLFYGRAMITLFGAATGLLIFFWSRSLFGWRGAFLSLGLFVFCPSFLAHGALATSDVVMTFFFLASVGAWWRHLENPGVSGAALSATTLGLAFVAKFSAVLLPPMLALIALIWAVETARLSGWRAVLTRLTRTTLLHAVVTWAVVWLFYGFRYSAFAPPVAAEASFNFSWGAILTDLGWPAKVVWFLKEWHVLPEAWLHGFSFVLQFAQSRGAFLSGEYSVTGWVSFFPFAFLIKTPLPLLLLFFGSGIMFFVERRRLLAASPWSKLRRFTPLGVLFVVYWITSLTSHLNIGHRHILPTYPVLFIAIGWLASWLDVRRPIWAALIVAIASWHVAESFRARPHYLAYFNHLIGGSSHGWRHLVDSSLDWGQDLPGLKTWLDAHPSDEKLFLSYFGTGDPEHEGIEAIPLPSLPRVGKPRPWHALTAGTYAVSATMLQHVYSSVRGDWTLALEQEFQTLRPLEPTFLVYHGDARMRAELQQETSAERWQQLWTRYETLRFARLCYFLRVRKPEEVIGHTIFIYRLSPSEVAAATGGSLAEWKALIERAVEQRRR